MPISPADRRQFGFAGQIGHIKDYVQILFVRFDRTKGGGKLRCEDFIQILGENDKYSGPMERIGKKIRELSSVPGLDVQLFFERVLLNFLLGNGDAHLKNFSMPTSGAVAFFTPQAMLRCPCGSISRAMGLRFAKASAAVRLRQVVVLPTPPF